MLFWCFLLASSLNSWNKQFFSWNRFFEFLKQAKQSSSSCCRSSSEEPLRKPSFLNSMVRFWTEEHLGKEEPHHKNRSENLLFWTAEENSERFLKQAVLFFERFFRNEPFFSSYVLFSEQHPKETVFSSATCFKNSKKRTKQHTWCCSENSRTTQ